MAFKHKLFTLAVGLSSFVNLYGQQTSSSETPQPPVTVQNHSETSRLLIGKYARYNPLDQTDWNKFFSSVSLRHLTPQQAENIQSLCKEASDKAPFYRRLIREYSANAYVTASDEDLEYLKTNGIGSISFTRDKRLIFAEDNTDFGQGLFFHETHHMTQESKGLLLHDSSYENTFIANKVLEAESENISLEMAADNVTYDTYYRRLKQYNKDKLSKTVKDSEIPYAKNLSASQKEQAKDLYLNARASEITMAQCILLRMQPNGFDTMRLVNEFGLPILPEEIASIERWRVLYNRQATNKATGNVSRIDIQEDSETALADAKHFQDIMQERYPDLSGTAFFQMGLTPIQLQQQGYIPSAPQQSTTYYFSNTYQKSAETVVSENGVGQFVYDMDGHTIYECHLNSRGVRDGREAYYSYATGTPQTVISKQWNNGVQVGTEEFHYSAPVQGASDVFRTYLSGRLTSETQRLGGQDVLKKEGENLLSGYADALVTEYRQGNPTGWIQYDKYGFKKESSSKDENGNKWSALYAKDSQTQTTYVASYKKMNKYGQLLESGKDSGDDAHLLWCERYDKNGRTCAKGYALNGNQQPIGVWQVVNSQSRKTSLVCYTEDAEISKVVEVPAVSLQNVGYKKDTVDTNHYTFACGKGLVKHAYLDEKTGFISCSGATDKEGNKVGTWTYFTQNGSKLCDQTYKNDELISEVGYDNKGLKMTYRMEPLDNETNQWTYYYGDEKTPWYSCQKDDETDDVQSYAYYYANGSVKEECNNGVTKYYTSGPDHRVSAYAFGQRYVEYYQDTPVSVVKSERLDMGSQIVTTGYTRGGKKLYKTTVDRKGKGTQEFYRIDANGKEQVVASGQVETGVNGKIKKTGEWKFSNGRTAYYQKGVCVKQVQKPVNTTIKARLTSQISR